MSERTERERLRPVLISIMANYAPERAADMILGLVVDIREAAPGPTTPAAPSANGEGHRKASTPRTSNPPRGDAHPPARRARAPRLPPPLPDPSAPGVRPLEPFEWYTIQETEVFLGIGNQSIRNILRMQPGTLQTKKEKGDGGVQRTVILGRSIIALRHKREKAARGVASVEGRREEETGEPPSGSSEELGDLPPPDEE